MAGTGPEFTGFSRRPVLNCQADVAFLASTADGAGVFVERGGKLEPIHRTADGVEQYSMLAINDAGTVLFYYVPAERTDREGGRAKLMTGKGTGPNDVTDGVRYFANKAAINNAGSIAYVGSYISGDSLLPGIIMANGQQSTLLVERQAGVFTSFGGSGIAINDQGVVAFDGMLRDGRSGLFSASPNGLGTLLDVDSGIDRFSGVAMNNSGDVAFLGFVRIDERRSRGSVYLLRNGQLQDAAGERYRSVYGYPNLNDAGGVAFMAYSSADAPPGIYVGPDPSADNVIVQGEQISGRQVSRLYLGTNALNNAGQIVFRADFADGGQGIVLASPAAGAHISAGDCAHVQTITPLMTDAEDNGVRALRDSIGTSGWVAGQRNRFTDLLEAGRYDAIVAPFQPDGDTLDAVGRSMLARRLAESLERTGDYAVADPGLVEKALGEPARYVTPEELLDLGRKLGVSTVVLGRVGHNRKHQFDIRLDVWQDEPGRVKLLSPIQRFEWRDLQFSDVELPYRVFAPIADEAAARIAGHDPDRRETGRFTVGSYPALPSSLDQLLRRAAASPLDEAQQLAFLGSLYPRSIQSRSRDHLFERALLALDRVERGAPGRAVLEARALIALNRRPAALAALGDPTTAEGRALLAYLNSDMPGLESILDAIENATSRLMAEMDLQHLRYLFDRPFDADRARLLLESHPVWGPFISQRYLDGDVWGGGSNALTKLGLDTLVPNVFVSLEGFLQGQQTQAALPDEPEIAMVAIDHIDAAYDRIAPLSLRSRRDQISPHLADVLELARALVLRNAIDSSRVERSARGRPDVARRNLAAYESLFMGNPQFTLEQSEALFAQSRRNLTGEQSDALSHAASELARKGFFWLGQQDETTLRVSAWPESLFPEAKAMDEATQAAAFFTYDFPSRLGTQSLILESTESEHQAAMKQCLDYTLSDLNCALQYQQGLLKQSPPRSMEAEAVVASLDSRFIGHPQRTDALISMRRRLGQDISEEAIYRQAIADETNDWRPYWIVGSALVSDNRYAEARDTYLRYPGFNRRGIADNVALSNHSYEAGSRLYWTGASEEAKPLLQIAAALGTGSSASLESASRLALLDRDWQQAMDYSLQRARRYDSAYAYRDYMALLHLQGRSDESWALFDTLLNDGTGIQIWTAAYLGHRINGASLDEIVSWATDSVRGFSTSPRVQSMDPVSRYIFVADVVDRLPATNLGAILRRLDPRFQSSDRPAGRVVRDLDTGQEHTETAEFIRIALAADALAAFYRGDMSRAQSILEEVGGLPELQEYLPYYTIAALTTGDTARLEQYLKVNAQQDESSEPGAIDNASRYYDRLAMALVAGYRNDHATALAYLTAALNNRPFTERRTIFTFYQLLETCEHLYETTGEDAYRAMGYELAVRFQIIQPMYPWAYAFGAKLAPTAADRTRELAAAMVLDPESLRVSKMSQDERDRAKQWLRTNGSPFKASNANRLIAALQ